MSIADGSSQLVRYLYSTWRGPGPNLSRGALGMLVCAHHSLSFAASFFRYATKKKIYRGSVLTKYSWRGAGSSPAVRSLSRRVRRFIKKWWWKMRYVSVTYVRLTPVTGGKLLAAEAIWHLISHSLFHSSWLLWKKNYFKIRAWKFRLWSKKKIKRKLYFDCPSHFIYPARHEWVWAQICQHNWLLNSSFKGE